MDLDGKLDRFEFGPLREDLEKQLRAIAKRMNALKAQGGGTMSEDDAAGIRKQLIQQFHCISCDRPVNMMSHKLVSLC